VLEGRDWLCVYCDKCYFKSNSLVFHVRQKHSEEPTARKFIKTQLCRAGRRESPEDTHRDSIRAQKTERTPLLEEEHVQGGPVPTLEQFN